MTFDHPPINTITATTVLGLAQRVGLIEQDPDLNVVVFDSVNPDFYLAITTWRTTKATVGASWSRLAPTPARLSEP